MALFAPEVVRVAQSALPVHIYCGPGTGPITLPGGQVYLPDQIHQGGTTAANAYHPTPAGIYGGEVYGPFQYTFTGLDPTKTYALTLYFTEDYVRGPGQRVFEVAANTQSNVVLPNEDIWLDASKLYPGLTDLRGEPVAHEVDVTPNGFGTLTIYFLRLPTKNNPELDALDLVVKTDAVAAAAGPAQIGPPEPPDQSGAGPTGP